MKILVLVEDYTTKSRVAMNYVHTRNINYRAIDSSIQVDVLCFRAKSSYTIDNIDVIAPSDFRVEANKYDLLVSHAPNVRKHVQFFKQYEKHFPKIVMFFHGHEVLRKNADYPWPYPYRRVDILRRVLIQNAYDSFKFKVLSKTLSGLKDKVHLIFVSDWLRQRFVKNIKGIDLSGISSVIHNIAGDVFHAENYSRATPVKGDFITIRNNLDDSKYAIDVVVNLAKSNPTKTFHVIGFGRYFDHFEKPRNLVHEKRNLMHHEIVELLNQYSCALMPTRVDAQGVMVCEMALYGIPVITSDLEICKEMLADMYNVRFIDNETKNIDLSGMLEQFDLSLDNKSIDRFSLENTVKRELNLFYEMCGSRT